MPLVFLCQLPVDPADIVILAPGIVISLLAAAEFISCHQHGHSLGQEENDCQSPAAPVAQRLYCWIVGIAFGTGIPTQVVVVSIPVVLTVDQVMFFIVADKIGQGKTVMAGDKIDGITGFAAVMLIPTLSYPISISFLGQLDWGPVIGGYIGALLLGGAFSAIGLFASSLTRNQIIAFIIGAAICVSLTLVDKMLFFFPEELLGPMEYLGADFHFQNISKGIIDSRDILYFLSVIFVALYSTHLVMLDRD